MGDNIQDNVFDKIQEVDLKKTMEKSYIDYAIKYYKNHYNLDNYNDRKQMTIRVSSLIDNF